MGALIHFDSVLVNEYARAPKGVKSAILDDVVAVTGWTRARARRAVTRAVAGIDSGNRGRPSPYGAEARDVLRDLWDILGQPASKYLAAVLPDALDSLVRARKLGRVSEAALGQLSQMSAATIDRILADDRSEQWRTPAWQADPRVMLQRAIGRPPRGLRAPNEPGVLLVSVLWHCGRADHTRSVSSIAAVDLFSGWTEVVALHDFTPELVSGALDELAGRMPMRVTEIVSAKGTVQAGSTMAQWARARGVTFTSSRPHSFDELRAPERSDGTRNVFARGYSGHAAVLALSALYEPLAEFLNIFTAHRGVGGDQAPATPYRRLVAAGVVPPGPLEGRDPAELSAAIGDRLDDLERHHRGQLDYQSAIRLVASA